MPGTNGDGLGVDTYIQFELAKRDPNNAGWQRDLSVSYDRFGDVARHQGNLEEAGKADPELELQVQTTIKRFANAYKNADGMVWGLARNKVVARKAEEEIAFREWIAADPGLAALREGLEPFTLHPPDLQEPLTLGVAWAMYAVATALYSIPLLLGCYHGRS